MHTHYVRYTEGGATGRPVDHRHAHSAAHTHTAAREGETAALEQDQESIIALPAAAAAYRNPAATMDCHHYSFGRMDCPSARYLGHDELRCEHGVWKVNSSDILNHWTPAQAEGLRRVRKQRAWDEMARQHSPERVRAAYGPRP